MTIIPSVELHWWIWFPKWTKHRKLSPKTAYMKRVEINVFCWLTNPERILWRKMWKSQVHTAWVLRTMKTAYVVKIFYWHIFGKYMGTYIYIFPVLFIKYMRDIDKIFMVFALRRIPCEGDIFGKPCLKNPFGCAIWFDFSFLNW